MRLKPEMIKRYSFLVQVERVTKKMSEDKKEFDLKMQEYAQLLDIRADRIRVSVLILHALSKLFAVDVVVVVIATAAACFSLLLMFACCNEFNHCNLDLLCPKRVCTSIKSCFLLFTET